MGNIGNGVINTFVDGDIVSANGTSPALLRSALNPKMQIIQAAVDDNDTRISVLEGQLTALGTTSVQYNVKAAPFNAIGNGIADDTAAIQAAITQAVANQGVVVFPTGTYKITDRLNIAGNCTLIADGSSTSVIIKQYTAVKETFRITGSNVLIQDLNIDTQASPSSLYVINNSSTIVSSPLTNIIIQRCRFYSSNASVFGGVEIRFCTGAVIKDCTFTTSSQAVALMSCTKSNVSGNTITGANGSIQLTRTTGLSLANSPQCTNCIVENNTISGDRSNSIYLISPKNCTIRSNFITSANPSGGGFYAIYINSSTDGASTIHSTYTTISDNTVDNTGWVSTAISAIYLTYTRFTVISGNVFNELSYMSVNVSYSLNVIGNQFTNMIAFAIITDASSGDVVISNNGFTDIYSNASTTSAIFLSSASNGRPYTITGNAVYRGTKSATYINTYGVYVSSPAQDFTNINVSGNAFVKNSTIAYYSTSATVFCYYYEEPSGDRVFLSPSGSFPTAGTWVIGDKVLVQSPTAGGYIGYVCTTAGTPGTWKGYGAIQP